MVGEPVDAVVTGAASGIGWACAARIRREGYRVLAVDVNETGLGDIHDEGLETLTADLSSEEARDRVVEAAAGARYLVNAAGIIRLRPILESGVADLREIFSVNVEAVWDLTSRIGRDMPAGGAVVNVSSASAKLAATIECAAYAASKAAVLSVTRSFAYAFATQGVRVNAIVPGIIDTPMQDEVMEKVARYRGVPPEEMRRSRNSTIPLGRPGTPDDTAAVVWFLLSDEARYMTGQAVNCTGGQIMW